METPFEVVLAAYGLSKHNIRGTIASEDGELLPLVTRKLRGYFADAARVNPTIFGVREEVAHDAGAGGWPRPEGLESVIRIELENGTEVKVVALDQRKAADGTPAVYSFGGVYRPAGNNADPTNETLYFLGPARAEELASLATPFPTVWPRTFGSLLVLDVGIYLARKDGRAAELDVLLAEKQDEHNRYIQWLEHADAAEARAHTAHRRIHPPGATVG